MADDELKGLFEQSMLAGMADIVPEVLAGEEVPPDAVAAARAGGQVELADGRQVRLLERTALRPDPLQVRTLGTLANLQERAGVGDVVAVAVLTSIQSLADSIREVGLLQPLGVASLPAGAGYVVVHGHRRLLALELAGVAEVLCVVVGTVKETARILMQVAENMQRADLGEADVAEAMTQYRAALARERAVEPEAVPWGDVAAVFGMSDDNRKRIQRLRRLADEAYEIAREARLTERVLRPLLQYLQQVAEATVPALDAEAQTRLVLSVAEKGGEASAALVESLLQRELGTGGGGEIPAGRSRLGIRLERRWQGAEKTLGTLRSQWAKMTTPDRETLRGQLVATRQALDELLQGEPE